MKFCGEQIVTETPVISHVSSSISKKISAVSQTVSRFVNIAKSAKLPMIKLPKLWYPYRTSILLYLNKFKEKIT